MWVIIKKELTELWRDSRFHYAAILLVILLGFASYVGLQQYQSTNEEYNVAKQAEREIWETQGDKNPHSAAHYGTYAFKPKFALSLFDNGVNKYTGNSIFLEAHKRNEAAHSEVSDETEMARFGSLSLNFVLLYLLPLIIMLLGYDTITKEREMDTLRLLKSQGTPSLRIIMGKWIAVALPVVIITSIVFLLLGIVLSSLSSFGYFSWSSLAMLYITYLLYYLIISAVVILISLWSKSSGLALVSSLFFWIIFCFVAPKVATNYANSLHPYPSKQEFYANVKVDKEKGLDGHNPWSAEAELLKKETLAEYGVDSVEQLPFNYDAYRMQKGEEHESAVYKKHYSLLKDVFHKQNGVYRSMAVISPFIPLRLLSMDIANTSYIAHWNFSDAAEDYRIAKQAFLNGDFKDNSKTGDWDYKMSGEGYKRLPKFEYTPPILSATIQSNTGNLLILLLWLLIPAAFLIFSAKKL